MQTMSSFVDCSKSGHDAPYFIASIVGFNRKFIYDLRELCEFKVRRHLVGYKENSFFAYHLFGLMKRPKLHAKIRNFIGFACQQPFQVLLG
jgi:hypothetical protein